MIPLRDDNPTYTFPFVTLTIIVVNVLIYLFQLMLDPDVLEVFIYKAAAIPFEITNLTDIDPRGFVPPPLTMFTAMFVHGGLFHLLSNMLYLWIFGDNIEDRLGHFKFFVFYILTGLAASVAHVLTEPSSTVPMIGASGAIAGVLGAYFLLFPRAHVLTLVFLLFFVNIVKLPAVLFLGLWFFLQVLSAGESGTGGGVAWFAHIGGFVAGGICIFILRPKKIRGRWGRRL